MSSLYRASLTELGARSPKARSDWRIRLKRAIRPPSACLNTARRLNWLMAHLDPSARILDLGSGTRRLRRGVINLEIGPFPNVNVIGAGGALPFTRDGLDAVVCQGVLEHVREPEAVVAEIERTLRPGGYLYVEVPFMQGFHADPHDYQRYTLTGIEYLFRRFYKEESGVCVGPTSTLAWVLREYLALFVGSGKVRTAGTILFGWLTFWIKYLDLLLARHPQAHFIASGLFFYGTKPGVE